MTFRVGLGLRVVVLGHVCVACFGFLDVLFTKVGMMVIGLCGVLVHYHVLGHILSRFDLLNLGQSVVRPIISVLLSQ